ASAWRSGIPMSEPFDDEDERRPLAAPARMIVRYVWRRWMKYPVHLWGFMVLYVIAVGCDLALPAVSGAMVEMLGQGPRPDSGVTGVYLMFVAVAFGFYFFRNVSVRFWIPLAANNMRDIAVDGFKDVQRFSADWHADNFAGATVRRVSRAMGAYDMISDTFIW